MTINQELPLISIIMPVFNCENYLSMSMKSILQQSHKNFEFIVINDGSTDNSIKIIENFNDFRIKVINFNSNSGISNALNVGISNSSGKYIARMDADDISERNRLEIQVKFLENNPDVGIIGSYGKIIDLKSKKIGIYPVPLSNIEIRWYSLFNSPFIHPSILIQKKIFDNSNLRYRDNYPYSEDYYLWSDLLPLTTSINLKQPLLNYRVHQTNMNKNQTNLKINNAKLIALRNIRKTFQGLDLSDDVLISLIEFFNRIPNKMVQSRNDVYIIFENLIFLFNHFIASNNEIETKQLRKNFTIRISRRLLRYPIPKEFPKIVNELTAINKAWFFDYLVTIPFSISQRVINNKIRKLNESIS